MDQADGNTGLHHISQLLSPIARDDVELNGFADYQWRLLAVGNLAPRAAMGRFVPVTRGRNPPATASQIGVRIFRIAKLMF